MIMCGLTTVEEIIDEIITESDDMAAWMTYVLCMGMHAWSVPDMHAWSVPDMGSGLIILFSGWAYVRPAHAFSYR